MGVEFYSNFLKSNLFVFIYLNTAEEKKIRYWLKKNHKVNTDVIIQPEIIMKIKIKFRLCATQH